MLRSEAFRRNAARVLAHAARIASVTRVHALAGRRGMRAACLDACALQVHEALSRLSEAVTAGDLDEGQALLARADELLAGARARVAWRSREPAAPGRRRRE